MLSQSDTKGHVVFKKDDIFNKAKNLYTEILFNELLEDKRYIESIEERSKKLYKECIRLSSVFKTTDEEVMMRFSCSLFTSPSTMISITQHWQRMCGHTIYPKEYQGEGRVWTTLLHLMVCDSILSTEMVPMFQTYETRVYLYGIESCPIMESLYERGLFHGTCLSEEIVPVEKRVFSPSFLRFDPGYLPTLSGRCCLCLLGSRGVFNHTQYRPGSDCCAIQTNLRDEMSFIYETIFDYFRPCIIGCMLLSFSWASYKSKSTFFKDRFSVFVASLVLHIDNVIIPCLSEGSKGEYPFDEKVIIRLNILKTVIEHFLEVEGTKGYTEETIKDLYNYMWYRIA